MQPTERDSGPGDDRRPPWDPSTDVTVDHASPVPLYFQVASQIENAIDAGLLPVGTRLDNEIELASQLGLSRPTIRQAIGSLVDKGLVIRKRGAGTQVVFNRVKRPLELTSLYDDLSRIGQHPSTRILANETESASPELAHQLGIDEGDEIRRIERVRSARDEPIARMRNYLPAHLLNPTNAALEKHGLYQLLRGEGIHLHAAHQTIGARVATRVDSELLDEPEAAPLLTMERTTYDREGNVVEFGSHVYRASRYSFDLSLRGEV